MACCAQAGFSPDTRVALHDVFAGRSLGWHRRSYRLAQPLPTHGAVLLRLSYSPQYGARDEL